MQVAEVWRYPVKSLRGERLQSADIGWDGIAGDRLAHVRQQSGGVAEGDPVLLVELEAEGEPPLGNGMDPFAWSRQRLA